MESGTDSSPASSVTRFDHRAFSGRERFTQIGGGSLGAKARGLAAIGPILEDRIAPHFRSAVSVGIPLLTVIATDFFDGFMEQSGLREMVNSSPSDDQLLNAFQRAELPPLLVRDLRAFAARIRTPLAVRSSSLLEDAMHEPLAGVYVTRMIPNSHPDLEGRVRQLCAAIKHVYASTFLGKASAFLRGTEHRAADEKMAVIIQQVVGSRRGDRFYPHVSGVARSFNFYPLGLGRPEDGVVALALGLGKVIVEDGIAWSFSPACPQANPPYNTLDDLIEQTQKSFWAIDMTETSEQVPAGSAEQLRRYALADAEQDGSLALIASTYREEDERIVMGVSGHGPRVLDFGQLLKTDLLPLAPLLTECLRRCEDVLGTMVEIEFAMTFPDPDPLPARFGFLQVRPMVASRAQVEVRIEELPAERVLVACESALGNGMDTSIRDIVYVKPRTFDVEHTRSIASQLDALNRQLTTETAPYLLIGFGRWGTSDPSAGIPVNFAQVSGARVMVETTLPCIDYILSQGSHFFHNITCSKVLYFSVGHTGAHTIDWGWLDRQQAVNETEYVRHVRLPEPLTVKVDGRTNRGVILK